MNGTKMAGKTIGEVGKIIGIPTRELKYFIEQDIMRPSGRTESGYWLYSEEDIRRAQLASLCRTLDFPVKAIRTILADPASHWQGELEQHILRLVNKRDRVEAQLRSAKLLLYNDAWEALRIYYDNLAGKDALAAK